MEPPAPYRFEEDLARATARVPEVLAALRGHSRVDLTGLPSGAAAYVLSRAATEGAPPVLVLTADLASARRTATDLSHFLGEQSKGVLFYPSSDITPYLEVAPDRRAAMDRLSALFHLAQGLPSSFVVAPAAGAIRRVPPREAIRGRSAVVRAEEELDRDAFLDTLVQAGYLRVPVVEDPGTFAVRGGIVDVYPPHSEYPARIELDDWLVLSIKLFDSDNQRTVGNAEKIFVHPVRDTLQGPEDLRRARAKVRDLCDSIDLPTTKTAQLLDDIESGRSFYGIEGYLPAFHDHLETLLDYLPAEAPVVVLDPTAIARQVAAELSHAEADFEARRQGGNPAYPLEAHYADESELAKRLSARRLAVVHRLVVGGEPDEEESPLSFLETVDADAVLSLGAEDQQALAAELKGGRGKRGGGDALSPLAKRATAWTEAGLAVVFTARTTAQADRLRKLLRSYELVVQTEESAEPQPGTVAITVGALGSGFVFPTEAIAFVTEEEIFGSRSHRQRRQRKEHTDRTQAFVEDLRELEVGDFVVHIDHGIGRYLGLERKTLGISEYERLKGREAASVEVLIVEYNGGDKLYLPVTRLNQIQKLSGREGHKPKIDKLGGQTFARTKAKVRKKVQELADELLRLYAQRAALRRDPIAGAGREYDEFEATFPFEETPDQARAIDEVLADLEGEKPMDRVICGDVGFGKTEVALRAAFRTAMAGRQVALLCPTTVLAQQHFLTFTDRLADYPLRVEVLSRFVEKKDQSGILSGLKDGTVDVVVGTHRILSKDVHFKELGLLVVDEEQRFGVAHKERIKKLRTKVDVLTLSATPIPRTLQLAVGGLRDLSLITTAPVDRRAVRTFVSRWDEHVIAEAIRREIARGGQIFFVYNRIEGLYERASKLKQLVPEARFAVAHGQLKSEPLERVMTDFVDGRHDVLCSTAIVESGLDIPRANTILIDRADIFGLAQLYQLRGRVGRSKERAYCYLLTPPPSKMSDEARYRIEALERFTELGSGFHVASLDMELRGAGDLLGGDQSGTMAQVGFDLFVHMLEEAVAELRGEPLVHDVDTELTFADNQHLPEGYIDDVGLRLSFYKRFASAPDEQAVQELAEEMEDRFGPPPDAARRYVRAMALKPALRELRVLGCEASPTRVTLHLREDTPLSPQKVMAAVAQPRSAMSLTPDMKLVRRYDAEARIDGIQRVEQLFSELADLRKDDA